MHTMYRGQTSGVPQEYIMSNKTGKYYLIIFLSSFIFSPSLTSSTYSL